MVIVSDNGLFLLKIFNLASSAGFKQADCITMPSVGSQRQPVQGSLVITTDQLTIHVGRTQQILRIDIPPFGGTTQIFESTSFVGPACATAIQHTAQLCHSLNMALVSRVLQHFERKARRECTSVLTLVANDRVSQPIEKARQQSTASVGAISSQSEVGRSHIHLSEPCFSPDMIIRECFALPQPQEHCSNAPKCGLLNNGRKRYSHFHKKPMLDLINLTTFKHPEIHPQFLWISL